MINVINKIIEKNINDLKNDNNIISIFVVGSMVSNDYKIKKNNDFDIRFIVKEYNDEIRKKINRTLKQIKKDIERINIDCEISEIIGPVKMESKGNNNVLLHAITMTEKDLEDLPNIHKYSYSNNYKQLYGKDLIQKYKKINIIPDDIIKSVEGIDYCIDLIQRNKIGYTKRIKEEEKFLLKYEEKNASKNDMIELYKYSYIKTVSNILNMIKTNNISIKIGDYINFCEKEILLIDKIKNDLLEESDIEISKNSIISILLKLKKACLNIYKSKKYYNSLEWGIINEESKNMRDKGFGFLKEIKLPVGNNFSIKFKDLYKEKEKIIKELQGSNYLVLFEPPNNKFKRFGIDSVSSFEKIIKFIEKSNFNFDEYNISFIEKIQQLQNSFSGTVISDGKGKTIIEIIENTCDSRELTSTGADAQRIKQYKFVSFDDYQANVPKEIREIKDICQYFKGYYEFAYGAIRNMRDIYFTFYSSNDKYLNIFEGGKKYGKTLRNR